MSCGLMIERHVRPFSARLRSYAVIQTSTCKESLGSVSSPPPQSRIQRRQASGRRMHLAPLV
jgi:hypothetical protein